MPAQYDGNNYVMTQTDTMWWVTFISIVIVLTFALLCLYLWQVYRACETTLDHSADRVDAPEAVEGVLDADVARDGGDRELAHAGAGPGGAAG